MEAKIMKKFNCERRMVLENIVVRFKPSVFNLLDVVKLEINPKNLVNFVPYNIKHLEIIINKLLSYDYLTSPSFKLFTY